MWYRSYPLHAEESGGAGAGGGGGADAPTSGVESSPASQEPALAPLHWAAALPEDLQGLPIVKDTKSLTDFVKNAENTKRFVGESIRVPKAYDPVKGPAEGIDLTPMFKKLGMPEKVDDYAIDYGTPPEGVTFKVDPERERRFLVAAHKAGLAPWQLNILAQEDVRQKLDDANRQAGEEATAIAQGTAKLHELHGANTPTVQAHARFVYELMQQGLFGGPELSERVLTKMHEKGLMTDPDWVTGLAALGSQMRGGRYLGADQPIQGAETPADIASKLETLNAKLHKEGLTPTEEAEADRLYDLRARYQAA